MRRIGMLLALTMAFWLFNLPLAHAGSKPASIEDRVVSGKTVASGSSAQRQSGRGMNRRGLTGEHPGRGWKDPGQTQGSRNNIADPDCTGNRTIRQQPTNKGACDDPEGAADKPGGAGGLDPDRDFNNGCGNDADFEDDNNGVCGHSLAGARKEPELPKFRKRPLGRRPAQPVRETKKPVRVLGVRIRAIEPAPATLPATGYDPAGMTLVAITLVAAGRLMLRRAGRRQKRAGPYRPSSLHSGWVGDRSPLDSRRSAI